MIPLLSFSSSALNSGLTDFRLFHCMTENINATDGTRISDLSDVLADGMRAVCSSPLMCLEHVLYPSSRRDGGGGRSRQGEGGASMSRSGIQNVF